MIHSHIVLSAVLMSLVSLSAIAYGGDRRSKSGKYWVYVGTYTGPDSKGIHLVEFDAQSGDMQYSGVAAETENPTFVCTDPDFKNLYAANEAYGAAGGNVSAYAIDLATGKLTKLSQAPSSGKGPCHVSTDASGSMVMVANYGNGSFASMPLDDNGAIAGAGTTIQHTGGSKAVKNRQDGPHAHGIYAEPSGRYALAVDLGTDTVSAYEMSVSDGTLATTPAAVAKSAPGAGPRHLAMTPDGQFVYVTNELNNTVDVYRWDAGKPAFTHLQTTDTLPADFKGRSSTAEIAIHPDGRTVYVSNRGHDSIAVFRRDPATGLLAAAGHQSSEGGEPRHFEIDPTGRWMLIGNQKGNNLVLLEILPAGDLKATGRQLKIPAAVCSVFVPR